MNETFNERYTSTAAVAVCWGVGWWCLAGGVSAQGAVCSVCPGGGGGVSGRHPILWTEFLTHACENITFPQLRLRTVIHLCADDWIAERTMIASNDIGITETNKHSRTHGNCVEINRVVVAGIGRYAMKAITYKSCQECINVCWILEESRRLFSL